MFLETMHLKQSMLLIGIYKMKRDINLKKGDTGTCPKCDSDSYERTNLEATDDYILIDCSCLNCGIEFTEKFELINQTWEEKKIKFTQLTKTAKDTAINNYRQGG